MLPWTGSKINRAFAKAEVALSYPSPRHVQYKLQVTSYTSLQPWVLERYIQEPARQKTGGKREKEMREPGGEPGDGGGGGE